MNRPHRKVPEDAVLLRHFNEGMATKDIAALYSVSPSNVSRARARLVGKKTSDPEPVKDPAIWRGRRLAAPDHHKITKTVQQAVGLGYTPMVISLVRIKSLDGEYNG